MPSRAVIPEGLRLLADAAGADAAMAIAMARGGSRLEIPKRAEGSVLEELVGIDAARAIVNDLAGERFEIPLAKRALNDWLRARGLNQMQRARALMVARSTVKRWNDDSMPTLQPDLFEASR